MRSPRRDDAHGSGRFVQHPLPEKRRLLSYSLKGRRDDHIECRGGVRDAVSFELEPVEPEVFWTFQHELAEDSLRQGMLHKFGASGRMAMGGAEPHPHREPGTQVADPGLPHLPRRLRHRQEPDRCSSCRKARRRCGGNTSHPTPLPQGEREIAISPLIQVNHLRRREAVEVGRGGVAVGADVLAVDQVAQVQSGSSSAREMVSSASQVGPKTEQIASGPS